MSRKPYLKSIKLCYNERIINLKCMFRRKHFMADKKIVSIEDRIPQLKKARKRKANRRFVTYLTIILLLVLAIIYIQSPLSYVKTIDVHGNNRVEESSIIELSQIEMDQNYWGVELDKAKEGILEHPEISSVEIDRKWY